MSGAIILGLFTFHSDLLKYPSKLYSLSLCLKVNETIFILYLDLYTVFADKSLLRRSKSQWLSSSLIVDDSLAVTKDSLYEISCYIIDISYICCDL